MRCGASCGQPARLPRPPGRFAGMQGKEVYDPVGPLPAQAEEDVAEGGDEARWGPAGRSGASPPTVQRTVARWLPVAACACGVVAVVTLANAYCTPRGRLHRAGGPAAQEERATVRQAIAEFSAIQVRQLSSTEQRQLEQLLSATPEELPCKGPKKGDFCYATVMWALNVAWKQHGEWPIFTRLKDNASFDDVQLAIHMDVPETCPRPCPQDEKESKQPCKTAGNFGDTKECYSTVEWTMTTGMQEHPSWYAGLGQNSSFEDVQRHVHKDPDGKGGCPMPCDPPFCHTVTWADTRPDYKACVEILNWIQTSGMPENPDWFPGLDEGSSQWDIQDHVAKDENAEVYCPVPCEDDIDRSGAAGGGMEWVQAQ